MVIHTFCCRTSHTRTMVSWQPVPRITPTGWKAAVVMPQSSSGSDTCDQSRSLVHVGRAVRLAVRSATGMAISKKVAVELPVLGGVPAEQGVCLLSCKQGGESERAGKLYLHQAAGCGRIIKRPGLVHRCSDEVVVRGVHSHRRDLRQSGRQHFEVQARFGSKLGSLPIRQE